MSLASIAQSYFGPLLRLTGEMAPYLLLGFLLAGVLHAFVPRKLYTRYLAGNDLRSVVLATLFGIPLPLCSCGVIPTAMSMRREGASKGASVAFLIATPQTGVDSIAATASLLGGPFALLRPVAALFTAVCGGCVVGAVERRARQRDDNPQTDTQQPEPAAARSFADRCRQALRYGFSEMIQDIGGHLVVGLLIAGAIAVLVPDGFFNLFADRPLLNMCLVLLISAPMYICATGSVPIAAALMLKGLTPGAALVLLMAGPATNMAAIMVIGKVLGRRTLVTYLASIITGALGFGLLVDYLLPAAWFALPEHAGAMHACCHGAALSWWQQLCTGILLLLLAAALVTRHTCKCHKNTTTMEKSYRIEGMMCNHCKAHVEKAIGALDGVTSVEVDLASGTARVTGTASPEAVCAAVQAAGYACSAADA